MTDEQAQKLFEAAQNLMAYIAADACRVVAEWHGEANLVPYLETLPVSAARQLDEIVAELQHEEMDGPLPERDLRQRYEAAMAETRAAREKGLL